MTALRQTVTPVHPSYEGVWRAVVSTSALQLSDEVEVIIPAFDDVLSWGPCRWTPRGDLTTYPQKGDECIVVFDDLKFVWIVCWWPYS